jgi:hypothetical protein
MFVHARARQQQLLDWVCNHLILGCPLVCRCINKPQGHTCQMQSAYTRRTCSESRPHMQSQHTKPTAQLAGMPALMWKFLIILLPCSLGLCAFPHFCHVRMKNVQCYSVRLHTPVHQIPMHRRQPRTLITKCTYITLRSPNVRGLCTSVHTVGPKLR